MTTRRLLLDSIRHYWRTHLGVILGSALAALVLTGALMVGDSVKATLRAQAEARVGKIGEAQLCGERFVPWSREVEKRPQTVARTFVPGPAAAGVLMLSGTAARSDGKSRANKVQIVGVDDAFWKLSPSGALASSPATSTPRAAPIPAPTQAPGKSAASPGTNVAGEDASAPSRVAASEGVSLNERLAAQLGVQPGDELLLRLEKPSAFSKDAPLSGEDEGSVSLRVRVARVVGDADFGRFALASGQVPPHTAFVPLAALQEKLGIGEKVNLILQIAPPPASQAKTPSSAGRPSFFERLTSFVGDEKTFVKVGTLPAPDSPDEASTAGALMQQYDLRAVDLPHSSGIELRSPRIFLEPAIVEAGRQNESSVAQTDPSNAGNPKSKIQNLPRGLDSLTYFVNELRAGDGNGVPGFSPNNGENRAHAPKTNPQPGPSQAKADEHSARATPYSMVTAIDAAASGFVNPKLADDEIQITRWLADDLGVAPGAKVTVKYFVMGERRQLVEKARTFTVAAPILEMTEPQLNGSWMPDFPGLADKANCRDWKPGFDFDASRMRDKDQDYWTKFRGTPKAFVTLKTGQEMWGNRWGNLTSIRYPAGTKREQVERIAAFIDPAALGFRTVNLREQALAATNAPVDFGELFVYFSFFLIAAAAVLTGLLFTFTIEQRAAEAGLLLAVGWPVKKVRRLFLREGFVLAFIGSLAGALLAGLYTKGVLHALAGVWGGATGGTRFVFAPSAITMAIGVVSGVFVALFAMWLASRRLFKMEAAALLSGETAADGSGTAVPAVGVGQASSPVHVGAHTMESRDGRPTTTRGTPVPLRRAGRLRLSASAAVCLLAALALAFFAKGNPGAFFGAGALLLIAGCLFALARLRRVAGGTGAESIAQLGARNVSRRRGRSLATIAVLASGVFMVIAVDSFRKAAPEDFTGRDSGTGGFAFIGESSAPIYEDLNSAKGREAYALDDKLMSGVRVVQMRVRDGDDASCLNLNRAVQPRILGANFAELDQLDDREGNASGGLGFQPAAPGIVPGAMVVAGSPNHATTSANNPQRDTLAANEPSSTSEGPGRVPGPAGKIPALPDANVDARATTPGTRGRMRSPFSLAWRDVAANDSTAVPGVVDANTLQWAMQKKVGDVIEIPGERGEPVRVQFAATVSGSVLQGLVIIPERDFVANFPNIAGTRFFLVDCPREKMDAVREHLTRQLGDRGLELTPAVKRLAEFNAVENTYLSIFQVLGGLGLLLGSAGLGIVVARNVLERRREFGLLEAVGFTRGQLRHLVFAEHRWLIAGAILIGTASALIAVWPNLSAKLSVFPWREVLALIGAMALISSFWAWFATRLALRHSQIAALRSE